MIVRRTFANPRSGTVAVELAILLPLLVFLCAIGVDFARVFSRAILLETASRNACFWAAQDPVRAKDKPGIEAVALRDLADITPTPRITSQTYFGADGFEYVRVTIEYTFDTIMDFPGVPVRSDLVRSTDMRICPAYPKPGTY
jgi:Flp pilus assembly protein TadG